jgi:hypothetical protein
LRRQAKRAARSGDTGEFRDAVAFVHQSCDIVRECSRQIPTVTLAGSDRDAYGKGAGLPANNATRQEIVSAWPHFGEMTEWCASEGGVLH